MSKWTNEPYELKRISDISAQIIGMAIVGINLESGMVLEGAIRNINMGNNASSALRDGHWLYYGNFDIDMLDGQRVNIDMCSVKSVINLWEQKSKIYEGAGIIQIIK
jgi:phosphate starvation-inducible protein PhoH